MKPPRFCLTCNHLTTDGSRCNGCRITRDNERYARRGQREWYGAEYQAARRELLKRVHACEKCGSVDQLETDHVVPRSMSGGLMVLCKKCHDIKTTREKKVQS